MEPKLNTNEIRNIKCNENYVRGAQTMYASQEEEETSEKY